MLDELLDGLLDGDEGDLEGLEAEDAAEGEDWTDTAGEVLEKVQRAADIAGHVHTASGAVQQRREEEEGSGGWVAIVFTALTIVAIAALVASGQSSKAAAEEPSYDPPRTPT